MRAFRKSAHRRLPECPGGRQADGAGPGAAVGLQDLQGLGAGRDVPLLRRRGGSDSDALAMTRIREMGVRPVGRRMGGGSTIGV